MREVSTQQYSFQQMEFAIIFFKCSDSPNTQLENGKSFKTLFVHFNQWPDTEVARQAETDILAGKHVDIHYNDSGFWRCVENKMPEPRDLRTSGIFIPRVDSNTTEEQVKDVAEIVHNDATQEPLLNLAPKRPNWDLKRDLEPQMKRLRAMTDRASTHVHTHTRARARARV